MLRVLNHRKIDGESGSTELWILINDHNAIEFAHNLGND
jgi:hypothetical protein